MKQILLFILSGIFVFSAFSQNKKIVVLGSSTASGVGASLPDSASVNRLRFEFNKNNSDGIDTIVINLAHSGATTYYAMPNGFVPSSSYTPPRPTPNTDSNVTKALSLSPNIIIISFPSNDIAAGYSKKEVMDNLRLMYQTIVGAGVKCFISTTQPRDLGSMASQQLQFDLYDSIKVFFGAYSLNFWDDLVSNDGQYILKPEVNSGDGIHPNNLGHRLLFQRVFAKDMFNINVILPLSLTNFIAQLQNNTVVINWHTEREEPNSFFEIQRSDTGRDYKILDTKNAAGINRPADYSWTDQTPLTGKSFYRLKIVEPTKTSFSKVITIDNKEKDLSVTKLYLNSSGLTLNISCQKNQSVIINIINLSGAIVQKQKYDLLSPDTKLTLSISNLSVGEYLLKIISADGSADVERFTMLK